MTNYDAFFSWKTLLYPDKYQGILDDNIKPPITLHIYPTNKCNLKCDWCIMKDERSNGGELSEEVFINLIESANKMDVKSIQIVGGGEPTLYPHLHHIRKFNGFKLLATNGILLNKQHILDFDRIRISVDSGDSKNYNELKGVDRFDTVMGNINKVVRFRNEINSRHKKIGLGFVLNHLNYENVYNFCKKASELDVDFVHIRPTYYPKDSVEDKKTKDIIKIGSLSARAAQEHFKNIDINVVSEKFEGFWTERNYDKCLASPLIGVATATGEMSVCLDVFIKFGNLYKQSLEDIWGSDEHKEAISKIDLNKCPRCVMNKPNEIMKHVFIENKILKEFV